MGKGALFEDVVARDGALVKIQEVAHRAGLENLRTIESPITGTDGNVEFLVGGCGRGEITRGFIVCELCGGE